jgi:putative membrane protein
MSDPGTGGSEETGPLEARRSGHPSFGGFLAELVALLRRASDPRELLGVYLRGLAMGSADTVPGVSGGTIALVTGIYERLIAAITAVDVGALRSAWQLHRPAGRAAFLDLVERADVPFLGALGLGVATAVVTVAQVMSRLVDAYPAVTFAAFFGLIAASAVVLYDEVDVFEPRRLAVAVCGVVVAALVGGRVGLNGSHGPVIVFVAGTVAVSAMVLPGLSGAFLLILLGQYEYMLGKLKAFTGAIPALADGGSLDAVIEPGTDVVVFVGGAVVGLLTVAYVVRWALARYRVATLTFLVSLMVGGLRVPGQRVLASLDPTPGGVAAVVLAGLLGAAGVLALDRYTDDLDYVRSGD